MALWLIMANIIALAPNGWFGPWMNRQQLLSRLARDHRIVYATGALHSWMRGRASWRERPWLSTLVEADGVLVDRPGKLLSRVERIGPLDRIATARTVGRWRSAFDDPDAPLVCHLFHPTLAGYVDWIEPDYLIYHAYDLYAEAPGWSEQLEAEEARLVGRADLVLGSSRTIVDQLAARGAERPVYLPNGVDFAAFSNPGAAPDEVERLSHPRVGYVGALNRKVDLELLHAIASARPDWHIVQIGDIGSLDERGWRQLERLRRLGNVSLLGEVHYERLPAAMAALDVGLLAYRVSGDVWTRGIYPLKLHEYLAAGLPVVSSDIPSVHEYSQVVEIVPSDHACWIAAIERGIQRRHDSEGVALRRRIAAANDWDERADQLNAAIRRMIAARSRAEGDSGRADAPLDAASSVQGRSHVR